MQITYLHQYFNTPEMSGGTRSYEMARRLVAKGHEVNMVTSWREPGLYGDWYVTDEQGIKVHWLPVPYSNEMKYADRLRAFFRFAWSAARKAASLPADVVFASSTPLTISLPAVYAAKRQKVPMVFEVRDLWPELPIAMGALNNPLSIKIARWLERFSYQASREVIALSPGMVEGVVRTGFPRSRVTEIPNSADLDMFYPNPILGRGFRAQNGISDDKLLIVYAGTFGRINGVEYLIHLARALQHDTRFHLLAVGGGREYSKVRNLGRSLGVLGRNVTLLDSLPKSQMPAILAAADIAISLFLPLPEMEANSANKFFDGLASGSCVAVNYGGWQADLLAKTGAGLRLDRNPVVGAMQLKVFVADAKRLTMAKRSARMLAEERFSRDKLASKLEEVLIRAASLRS